MKAQGKHTDFTPRMARRPSFQPGPLGVRGERKQYRGS
jgi:hypothetical protein